MVLTWDNETWTPNGALSNTFDATPNNPGNDVTVTFTGGTGSLAIDLASLLQTPAITNSLQGGSSGGSYLEVATNLASAESITVTISFAQIPAGVEDVSFTLFDIDSGTRNEIIQSISATGVDGTTISYPTFSNGSAVTKTGSGATLTFTGNTASPDTGGASGNGNVVLDFDPTNQIRSVSFTFATSAGITTLPQQFAISDIQFTLVPEINPAWISAASCIGACAFVFFHRSRLRRSKRE